MTDNLPDVQPASLPTTLFGQAALFEDSDQLLALTDAQLRHLAALVGEDAESGLAQMRRRFGLLAWAGWLRFEGKPYEEYVAALARYVGVSPRTVKSWRDTVVEKQGLAVPPATDQRRKEAAEREEKSRSGQVRAGKQHGNRFIPADSTEALDKMSEGVDRRGETPAGPSSKTPSGPSSEREPTTGPPAPASTLSDPSSAGGDSVVGADAPPAGPNPTCPVPSLRQEASHVFSAVMDATEGFGAKLTPEEATAYDNRHKREMAAFRKAYGIDEPKPERRQGTISRPADRHVKAEVFINPHNCTHPKDSQNRTGYGVFCTDCKVRVR